MEKHSSSKQTPAVILIESDPITLDLYQRELCKSFVVYAFTELKGVIGILTKQDIQAVVIEPEIDSEKGWDLIHAIHEKFPLKFIPVIVCSTRDNNYMKPALEISKYLTKPVLPKTLREKILETIHEKDVKRKQA
jgi:response regulator RpfG family c-di-GMP phosphodiesterase